MDGIKLFNETLAGALIKNRRFLLKRPSYLRAFAQISANMRKQEKIRNRYLKEGIVVPPILIISVTNDCNLSCAGCYACAQGREKESEMSSGEIERIVGEAAESGVCVVMIAGGEPLLKKGIRNLPENHPGTLFVMFTNGLLLSDEKLPFNLVPMLSLEGGKESTDERRGEGIYEKVMGVMERLDSQGSLFGASVTLTSANFREVINSGYLAALEKKGCRAAFLIEYVPSGDEDASLCLTAEQKSELRAVEKKLFRKHNMLVVTLPGDEEQYGGCLASGRGFLHLSSTGALEACPFAPYSDTNVKGRPLIEALKSPLLKRIRDNHSLLKEGRGGCALKDNIELIESLNATE